MTEFALHGHDLFGEVVKPKASGPVAERFTLPPFTILDARTGEWQERKRAWAALGQNLSCELKMEMRCSYGGNLSMTVLISEQGYDKQASTAQCSAMRVNTYRHCSYAKRMQLLMQSGLIAGITPMSTAKRWSQGTLDFASSQQVGDDAE